jgi:hypothetical protein
VMTYMQGHEYSSKRAEEKKEFEEPYLVPRNPIACAAARRLLLFFLFFWKQGGIDGSASRQDHSFRYLGGRARSWLEIPLHVPLPPARPSRRLRGRPPRWLALKKQPGREEEQEAAAGSIGKAAGPWRIPPALIAALSVSVKGAVDRTHMHESRARSATRFAPR